MPGHQRLIALLAPGVVMRAASHVAAAFVAALAPAHRLVAALVTALAVAPAVTPAFAVALAASLAAPAPARAQPAPPPARAQAAPEWLLLPSTDGRTAAGERSPARTAVAALNAALAGRPRVYDTKQARSRFEQRGSTAPLMVSHSDLDALARDAQMALYHVAGGLHAKARDDVERTIARADKVLESLNRESLAAQQLLDACLYLVRAYLDGKDRERAREQALQCRRLVPDVEPDGTMHPPDVIGVLAEAEAQLRLRSPGSLRIESTPPGCAVFVNGRRLGTAPLELPQLGPGEYRVQAECEEGMPGRVHRATIGSTRVVVRIDTRFDAAVQTSLGLALRYPSAEEQRAHAYGDAVEVARVVGVTDVVLASVVAKGGAGKGGASGKAPSTGGGASGKAPSAGASGLRGGAVVQFQRIRVADGALLAAARVRLDPQARVIRVDEAVRALRDGQRVDLTGAAAPAAAARPPPTPALSRAPVTVAPRVATPGGPRGRSSGTPAPAPATVAPAPAPTSDAPAPAPASAASADPASTPPDVALDDDDADRDQADPADYPEGDDPADGPPHVAGIVAGAAGGATLLAGWALWVRQLDLELTYSDQKASGDDHTGTLRDLQDGEWLAPIVGGAGAVVGTAALPWLLPEADGVPVWGIVVGGAGVVVAAGGVGFLARGGACDEFDLEGRCTDVLSTSRFGAMLLETAVPMLGVPVTYWLRDALGGSASASVHIGADAALLHLRGVL
jgi:hypothetical protein